MVVCNIVGVDDNKAVGNVVSSALGCLVIDVEGYEDDATVGLDENSCVGLTLGYLVGLKDGDFEGLLV